MCYFIKFEGEMNGGPNVSIFKNRRIKTAQKNMGTKIAQFSKYGGLKLRERK
jgi:hypothetical protein